MKILFRILIFSIIFLSTLHPQTINKSGLDNSLKDYKAALVIYDQNNNVYTRYDQARCAQRFMPASTFKIPNALIGLETGVIPDSNYVIKWDGKPQFSKEWERDHTLKSAIFYSVVPYFRELARRVGREGMQYWLNKINYGNNTIGDKEDYFWLDNSLKISADEQVAFLKKFYSGRLPFSKRTIVIVKNILPAEYFKNAVLKYKTGTGKYDDGHYIAWLVGYVVKVQSTQPEADPPLAEKDKGQSSGAKEQGKKDERDGNNIYFFAFNVDAKSFNEAVELRNKIKSLMLKYLGVTE
jgi:beta-lactamase class D